MKTTSRRSTFTRKQAAQVKGLNERKVKSTERYAYRLAPWLREWKEAGLTQHQIADLLNRAGAYVPSEYEDDDPGFAPVPTKRWTQVQVSRMVALAAREDAKVAAIKARAGVKVFRRGQGLFAHPAEVPGADPNAFIPWRVLRYAHPDCWRLPDRLVYKRWAAHPSSVFPLEIGYRDELQSLEGKIYVLPRREPPPSKEEQAALDEAWKEIKEWRTAQAVLDAAENTRRAALTVSEREAEDARRDAESRKERREAYAKQKLLRRYRQEFTRLERSLALPPRPQALRQWTPESHIAGERALLEYATQREAEKKIARAMKRAAKKVDQGQ